MANGNQVAPNPPAAPAGAAAQAAGVAPPAPLTMVKDDLKSGNWLDWIGTIVSTVLMIVFIIIYIGDPLNTLLLAGLFGISVGWGCGLIATPYTVDEKNQMGGIAKVVSGVAGGYVVAKLDRVFDAIVPPVAKGSETAPRFPVELATHFGVCFVMFTVIFIFVYVTRTYKFDFKDFKAAINSMFSK